MFARVLRGEAALDDAFDYYAGWILDPLIQPHHEPIDETSFGFARRWGLGVLINDLRNVVRRAANRGRKVVLGGHSLGASTTLAYSAWDFEGRPGYRDIDGVVLIDGGLLGTYNGINRREAKRALAELGTISPFADILELGIPWAAGVLVELGGLYAKLDPTGASVLQAFPLVPPEFKPPVAATNRAALGYALDADTSPEELGMIHVRAGRLAPAGSPRDWDDGEVTPIARVAETFGQEPVNAVEWYYPRRLNIDVDGADNMKRNRVTRYLGVRTWHSREVRLQLYALEASLNEGRVPRGARRFIKRSRMPRRRSVLVDASATNSHLDPLIAAPASSAFLDTVVPFLRRVGR